MESYWIYVDHEGNEFKQRVDKEQIIEGQTYLGYKYEPEIKDWKNFNRYLNPSLCHFGKDWVTIVVGEGIKKAVKARLTDEMELFSKLAIASLEKNFPSNNNITIDLDYDIEIDTQSHLKLLPIDTDIRDEWKAIEINAKISMKFDIDGIQIFQDAEDFPTTILEFVIVEKAKILGTETVKTETRSFEDCLKIAYKTETKMTETSPISPADLPGESDTTIWYAPHVGIIKIKSETEKIFLHALSERDLVKKHASEEEASSITKPSVKTLQLKKYKILSDKTQNERAE